MRAKDSWIALASGTAVLLLHTGIFEVLDFLGRERVLARLDGAIERLEAPDAPTLAGN